MHASFFSHFDLSQPFFLASGATLPVVFMRGHTILIYYLGLFSTHPNLNLLVLYKHN